MNLLKLVRNLWVACVFSFLGATTVFAAEQARLDARLSAINSNTKITDQAFQEGLSILSFLTHKLDFDNQPQVEAIMKLQEEQVALQEKFLSQYKEAKTAEARKEAYDALISNYEKLKKRAEKL